MAVKDEQLAFLLERAATQVKEVEIEGCKVRFARLGINDNIELDRELGVNVFAEVIASTREGQAKFWGWEVQREVFFRSLKKVYPEITKEEAGTIVSLLPLDKQFELFVWIITGREPTPLQAG